MNEKKRTTVYFDTELLRRAKIFCAANDTSLSELLNQLLEEALNKAEEQQ